MPEAVSIQVGGNVDGSIVVGDNNLVVNTNHGTILYKQAGLQVRPCAYAPQPPRPPRGFINRKAELAKLEAWISANEIVLLHAPDGAGKSSLLKQAANSAAAKAMPNGVILVESVGADGQAFGPDDVIQSLFDALFESDPPLKVDAVSARTYLSNMRPLVVLDEVGLSPALQKSLPDLFPQGAILLATDLPVGGDFQRLPIGPLPRPEAVNLLATRSELTLNDANRASLDTICNLLSDVSLAIVITGNVLRETRTSPENALQAIQSITVSIPDPVSAALDRAFSFAFGKLSAEEQKILSAAALTPGISMAPEWLASSLGGVDAGAFIERLKALGLLFANSPRLRLPSGFRAPAQRAAVLDEDTLMPRLVKFLSVPLQKNPQDWDYIKDELGNFFGALAWAVRGRHWADVISLGRALDPYLTLHGLWDAWNTILGYILEAARESGQQTVQGWALHQLGTRLLGLGDKAQAGGLLNQALQIRLQIGDTAGAAFTRHNLNFLAPPPTTTKPAKPAGRIPPLAVAALSLLVLGALGFAGLRFFFPPTPPQIEKLYAEHPTLYYGAGAEDCGPTSTSINIVLSKDDPSFNPQAKYYYYNEAAGASFDLPLSYVGNATYQGKIQPDSEELGGNGGSIVVEAWVADGQPVATTSIAVRYLCATPTPLDSSGPLLSNLTASPSPSYYGPQAVECKSPYIVALSLDVEDPSGLESLSLRYRYESGSRIGEWREAKLSQSGAGHFTVSIDHNEAERALRVLDGVDGYLAWEVTALDTLGHRTVQTGPLAQVDYARCDITPPEILRPFASPGQTYYGARLSDCERSSLVEFYTRVRDDSKIVRVYLLYKYRLGKSYGPTYMWDLNLLSLEGSEGYYGSTIDNNFENRAQVTLKMSSGTLYWVIVAIDEFGNIARTKEDVLPVDYYCPAPG
jgi:hypothetical protein